jgi:hypothetical protein
MSVYGLSAAVCFIRRLLRFTAARTTHPHSREPVVHGATQRTPIKASSSQMAYVNENPFTISLRKVRP